MGILVPYFRSSSLGNWQFCQMQYYITYVLGHYSPSGKKAQLGTIVHKVMEVLANCKKLQQDGSKRTFIDDALGKIKFTTELLYTQEFVDSILERSYKHYTSDCIHEYEKADFNFCKRLTQVPIEQYNHIFDPRNRDIIAPEPHFDIEIKEPWAVYEYNGQKHNLRIKGTIDLVTKLNDDTIEVIDYKTGQRKDWATGEEKDYTKLTNDTQLLLYNYAISQLYPQYPNRIMTIFFLRQGGPFSLAFEDIDKEYFLKTLKEYFEEISSCKSPKPVSKNRKDFKCTKLCHYYKNNWLGTEKTMCHHVEDTIKTYGIEVATSKLAKDGFNPSYYSAPG